MPTIIIKNGKRSLKLTKRERDTLGNARVIIKDIADNFLEGDDNDLHMDALTASDTIETIVTILDNEKEKEAATNGKADA